MAGIVTYTELNTILSLSDLMDVHELQLIQDRVNG